MDRGTIVIRVNKKGVTFLTFDPGQRDKAQMYAEALHRNGEDPFICINLQEYVEELALLKGEAPPPSIEPVVDAGPKMPRREEQLADLIDAAFNKEPPGTGTRIEMENGDWPLIAAALRKSIL